MRWRIGLFLVVGLLAPLGVAAEASAQGAVLRPSKQVVTAGEIIELTGTSFSGTGVNIRVGPTRDSPVYRQALGPSFTVSFEVPNLAPGWHLVQGTQVTAAGRARGFTPGRTRIRVVGAGSAAGVPSARGLDGPGAPLLIAICGLVLLAATSALTVRRLRTLNRPLGN